MCDMQEKQVDGFQQLEEQCLDLAERASWVLEALPRPRMGPMGGIDMEETLRKTCQYVKNALAELRDAVQRVRELEAALLEAQATAAERDEAAASAAARVEEAGKRIAHADKRAADADASMERYAELSSGLEADRAKVRADMEQWASLLDGARKEAEALAQRRSDLEKDLTKVGEAKKEAEWADRRRAQAEKDATRLEKANDEARAGLSDEWRRLGEERRTLEENVENYNKAVGEYNQLKANALEKLHEEKARVDRRDQTIKRLEKDIGDGQQSVLVLKSERDAEAAKVKDRDQVITEMKLYQEKTLADELQTRLSHAGARIDTIQETAASEYHALAQKLDDMKISQAETLETFQENTQDIRDAMVSATKTMAEVTTVSKDLKRGMSPNTRAVNTTIEQIGAMSRQLQDMEEAYAARHRDEAARARKHMVELIHEIDSQTRQQHEQELAEVRRRHEAELTELRAEMDEKLAHVSRQCQENIDCAQTEARESRVVADELRQQLYRAREPAGSPQRRHKKARADDPQQHIQTPPPSASKGGGAVGPETAKWQAVLRSASDFWGSFEPRLIDRMGEPNYAVLLHQLGKVVRDAAARSHFMEFVHSDATGWHCVEAVIENGGASAMSPQEGKCTLKRHKKAAECLRVQRAGGCRLDFQFVKNR